MSILTPLRDHPHAFSAFCKAAFSEGLSFSLSVCPFAGRLPAPNFFLARTLSF